MSGKRQFDRVAVIVTAITLVITVLFMNGATFGLRVAARTMGYEDRLFDQTKVHTIDIVMNDWDEMIDNAADEEYYVAHVVIDGESYKNVGIRTKGNTSLSNVATLGSQRYSFKIEFDHYDSTKSYHGLDKLSLNNLIQDSTMMKDYLTYTMMNEFGVHSSLCSFVYITVNGQDWGLYLAVEGVEEAFLERNYGSDYGELYKPDSLSFGGGRGNGGDFDMGELDFNFDFGGASGDMSEENSSGGGFDPSALFGGAMPDMPSGGGTEMPDGIDSSDISEEFDPSAMFGGGVPEQSSSDRVETSDEIEPSSGLGGGMSDVPFSGGTEMPNGINPSDIAEDFDPSAMLGGRGEQGGGFGGGMGMGSGDVKLQYIDDDLDSYSNIWNNAKTDVTEADQLRLIASLKQLSTYEDIESVVDVEQVIRYFVVHNYVCNGDSYTGSMVHNYYLYEKDGKLSMIPWDYNLAFGTFSGGNATGTVNTPIDAPVSGGSSDRPMLHWIFESEAYTEAYHQYFSEFLSTVDMAEIIDNAYALIKDYVAKDPTAFYSYEEFELGVETLRQFCALRSESISMQLENNETTDDMNYVDASHITLSDMGSMGGGMGGGDRLGMSDRNDRDAMPSAPDAPGSSVPEFSEDRDDFNGSMPIGSDIPSSSAGEENGENMSSTGFPSARPDGFSGERPEGVDASDLPDGFNISDLPEGFDPSHSQDASDGNFSEQSFGDGAADGISGDSEGDREKDDNRLNGGKLQRTSGESSWDGSGKNASASDRTTWLGLALSVVVLALGLLVAKRYGR